ncbi:MAG: accessory gene regulator B family protein [Lachnospiraceae bacterium]|nr:accessory gene regulator B family protein [Lachnospiraceae bacterium]
MITQYSKVLANKLISASNTHANLEDLEVYIYGIECIVNTGVTTLLLLLWGFITSSILETVAWLLCFLLLRHYTGGIHAPTQISCIICSTLLGMLNFPIITLVNFSFMQVTTLYFIFIIIGIVFAPAKTKKREFSIKERKKCKLLVFVIIIICFFLAIVFPQSIGHAINYAIFVDIMLLFAKVIVDYVVNNLMGKN